ncbi:thrombospondin type 3 repeat-containing protein [archaeon]|nr:thrombospondin type 3 repeat-containing protein [archaeon]
MGLDETYAKLEDKYYAFLDGLEKKGIPIYSIVDPIEHAGIPSLPLFVGLVILLIGLAWYYMMPSVGGMQDVTFVITSQADGKFLDGATITAKLEGNEIATATTIQGQATLRNVPSDSEIDLIINKPGCTEYRTTVTPSLKNELKISMQCGGGGGLEGCLEISSDMEQTFLKDENGNPPESCEIRIYDPIDPLTTINHGWLIVDGALYVDDITEATCPSNINAHKVEITCKNSKYESTVSALLDKIKTENELILETISIEPTQQNATSDVLREIIVHIESMDGNPLEGIIVKAVNAEAEPITSEFSNVILEYTTGSTGNTQLIIPDGQAFYIAVEDPKGVYRNKVGETEYIASLEMITREINLQMSKGAGTIVTVKESGTQDPITSAMVTIIDSSGKHAGFPQRTNSKGEASFVLYKGKEYSLEVRHAMYEPINQTVTGGTDITVFLETVDPTKTGSLAIKTIKAHGAKDRLGGVRIKLIKNGKTYTETTTSSSGEAYLTGILAGSYTLKLLPPGATNYQEGPTVDIQPQNTTEITIEVIPEQITLELTTLVRINGKDIPKKNVEVQLWDAYYEERIETKTSGIERKVTFQIDKCTEVYFVLAYTETEEPNAGKKYGPLTSTPEEYCTNKEIKDLILKEKPDQTELNLDIFTQTGEIEEELIPGTHYNAKLSVALPEYTPNVIYKQITVELFVGNDGYLARTDQTPLVIEDIDLTDISVQDPYITSLHTADEYHYGEPTPPENEEGNSKYLKVTIGKYTPGTYELSIPIYVRSLAEQGNTIISYRATWMKPDGGLVYSQSGNWDEKNITILPPSSSNYHELETGSFYAYKAWLTATKSPEPILNTSITKNAYFYLHIDAITRDDIAAWEVPLTTIPDIAEMITYDGTVYRASGMTTEIAATNITGDTLTNDNNIYNLEKDDKVSLTITLKAIGPGKASLITFNDIRHTLSFAVSEIPALQKETLISGITATLQAQAHFTGGEEQYAENHWGTFDIEEETIPTNNKKFKLTFQFQNTDTIAKTGKMILDAKDKSLSFTGVTQNGAFSTGTQTYIQDIEFEIPPDGSEVIIEGTGTTQTTNDMDIYIYELGTLRPKEPWTSIQYGRIDYTASIKTYKEGGLLQEPSQGADEIRVWAYKEHDGTESNLEGGTITGDQVQLAYPGTNPVAYLKEDQYYQHMIAWDKPLKETLKATLLSDKFGKIIIEKDVSYLTFNPNPGSAIKTFTGVSLNPPQTKSKEITLTSYYDKAIGINIGKIERIGWEITIKATTRMKESEISGSYVDKETRENPSSMMIPSRGQLIIEVTATPTSTECRGEDWYNGNELLEIEVDELKEPIVYAFTLDCTIQGTPDIGFPGEQTYIVRSDVNPSSITHYDCFNNTHENQKETAYICDAEQLGAALLDGAQNLYSDPYTYETTFNYALGKDRLDYNVLSKVLEKHANRWTMDHVYSRESLAKETDTMDIILEDSIECGITKVKLEKVNFDQDIKITVLNTENKGRWCENTGQSYMIGLLNYDQNIRPDNGQYYSFEGTQAERIPKAIQYAQTKGNNITISSLLAYDATGIEPSSIGLSPTRLGGTPQTFLKYMDCEMHDTTQCPTFAINEFTGLRKECETDGDCGDQNCINGICATPCSDNTECTTGETCNGEYCITNEQVTGKDTSEEALKDAYPIIGYFDIDTKDNINLGLIYDQSRITTEQLDQYRALFMTRITQYATTGIEQGQETAYGWYSGSTNTRMIYVPTLDTHKDETIDLSSMDINVYIYYYEYNEEEDPIKNTKIAGDNNIFVTIEMNERPQYCMIGDLMPNGTILYKEPETSQKDEVVDNPDLRRPYAINSEWELLGKDGRKRVAAYCVDQKGITSKIAIAEIRLDTSGVEFASRKPERIAMYKPMLFKDNMPFLVRSKYADVTQCWISLKGSPTEGETDYEPNRPRDGSGSLCWNDKDDNKGNQSIPEKYRKEDGCCTITKKEDSSSGEHHYFNLWEVECNSPTIEKVNEDIPVEFWCATNLNHKVMLADFSMYRWDTEKPVFPMPRHFTLSVNGTAQSRPIGTVTTNTYNKGGIGLFFNEEIVWKTNTTGELETYEPLNASVNAEKITEKGLWLKYSEENTAILHDARDENGYKEFELVRKSEKRYDFKFIATDSDGVEACTAESGLQGETHPYITSCERTHAGDTTKVIVNCSIELKEGPNEVNISCRDTIGKSVNYTLNILLDETPPQVDWNSIAMTEMGGMVSEDEREMIPEITFTVNDTHSDVEQCTVTVDSVLKGLKSRFYKCTLTDNPDGKNKNAVCRPEGEIFLPLLLMSIEENSVTVNCTDEVQNLFSGTPIDERGDPRNFIGEASRPIEAMPADIVKMCEVLRYGATQDKISSLGFSDQSEDLDGVKELKDDIINQIDEDGIYFDMFYCGADTCGQKTNITKIELDEVSHIVGEQTKEFKVPMHAECLTEAACDIAITILTLGTGKVAQAAPKASKAAIATGRTARVLQRFKHTLKWMKQTKLSMLFSRSAIIQKVGKTGKLTKGLGGLSKTAKAWSPLLRLTTAYLGKGATEALGAAYFNTGASYMKASYSKIKTPSECQQHPGGSIADIAVDTVWHIVPVLPTLAKMATGDEFEAHICAAGKTIPADRYYTIFAKPVAKDSSAAGVAGAAFSVCFDSCDDFECQVVIGEHPMREEIIDLINQEIEEVEDVEEEGCLVNGKEDSDCDGTPDDTDNCVDVPNVQVNSDTDKYGDACDNCPETSNEDQADTDGDDVGDVCDNCKDAINPGQVNSDGDTHGDLCDNCPETDNEDQADTDGDGVGDACDNCKTTKNYFQLDNDNDTYGNACDGDIDGDGTPNEDETGDDDDLDGDGEKNKDDPDDDDDAELDEDDNTPYGPTTTTGL